MPEVKSVKVDNWGVFFLQKLQNFFNKTDYCDLTLQFKDNSQLKVHRLVLSACTDFFNVLEQRYNVTDDVLIMPRDLQADVVVPIVNFMYTGTLEFEMHMYARLLKTAKDMNMTVLLKLLEAHKRTVVEATRAQGTPVLLNKGANQRVNTYSRPATASSSSSSAAPAVAQRTYVSRRPITAAGKSAQTKSQFNPVITKIKTEKAEKSGSDAREAIRHITSTSYLRKNLPEPVQMVAKYANSSGTATKGPSRFEVSDDTTMQDTFESSFDNISYESKPLITASQVCKEEKDLDYESTSSSFEQLKRSYTGTTKRAYSGNSSQSPPVKKEKPNIQELKEFTEANRLRKEIVAEEFENEAADYYADDFQGSNDDDDDEYITPNEPAQATSTPAATSKGGNVIIKSDAVSPVNHAKIISEVLKKYPHLVKNNKNIKLKIMQKGGTSIKTSSAGKQASPKAVTTRAQVTAAVTQPAAVAKKTTAKTAPAQSNQPKKIDSRTMHALIAKGAENTTGPWLCLECGVHGRPISIPSYKGFRRHLINVHRQKIDARLCEHCGWRSTKRLDLHHHILVQHEIQPPKDLNYPKCGLCTFIALDQTTLRKHKEEDHQNQSSQQHCIYCNKTFAKEIVLYSHMRTYHKERAQEDGVMDFSDDETYEDDADKYEPNHPEMATASASNAGASENKIKVLSNITLSTKSSFVLDSSTGSGTTIISAENLNLEPSSEAEGLSNVASGIATSLAVLDSTAHTEGDTYQTTDDPNDLESTQYIEAEMANVHGELISGKKEGEESSEMITKFITEEGSELQLTDAQKAELLEQLQGQGDGNNVVMVLNDGGFEQLVYDAQEQANDEKVEGVSNETEVGAVNETGGETEEHEENEEAEEAEETEEVEEAEEADEPDTEEPDTEEPAVAEQPEAMEWQDAAASSEEDPDAIKNEDSQPEHDPVDADTSAENLENIQACISASKDDSVTGDELEEVKTEVEKDIAPTKEAKPNQLISELEGDWDDDDDDDDEIDESGDSQTKKSPKSLDDSDETILVSTVTRASAASSKTGKITKKTDTPETAKKTDKSVSNSLLDDWNDSQPSENVDADDETAESTKKEPKDGKVQKSEDEADAKTSKKVEKKSKPSEKTADSAKSSKNGRGVEIKTLINDWGDEDEDDAF